MAGGQGAPLKIHEQGTMDQGLFGFGFGSSIINQKRVVRSISSLDPLWNAELDMVN